MAERQDAIAAWLVANRSSETHAAPLAETALAVEGLNALAAAGRGEALDALLEWIAAGCAIRALAPEIETSASRIFKLVTAVEGFKVVSRPGRTEFRVRLPISGGLKGDAVQG